MSFSFTRNELKQTSSPVASRSAAFRIEGKEAARLPAKMGKLMTLVKTAGLSILQDSKKLFFPSLEKKQDRSTRANALKQRETRNFQYKIKLPPPLPPLRPPLLPPRPTILFPGLLMTKRNEQPQEIHPSRLLRRGKLEEEEEILERRRRSRRKIH